VSLLQGAGQYWVLRWQETPECRACDLPPLALAWGTAHADANNPHKELGRVPLASQTLKWWQAWASDAPPTTHTTSWLAASCRWPGMVFEQQAIDKVALQMSTELEDPATPAQALVLLGDQIYADAVGNLFNLQEADERLAQMYRDAWSRPSSRALFAQVPTYLAVDDHEYQDNWAGSFHPASDATFLNGFEAIFAYQWRWSHLTQHQPVVQLEDVSRSRSSVRGFWQEFQIGDLPAFAMDTRSERQPTPQRRLFSRAQMRAVRRWLLTHKDQAKVLCMGSVLGWVEHAWVSDPALANRGDGWAAYPLAWRWLVDVMVRHQIKHTVLLSGDFHFSGVAELQLRAKNLQPIKALSVVCSGWNASLPFINAKPEDFVLKHTVSWPGSDARASITSTAYSLGTALRQFSKLTLNPPDHTNKHGSLTITVFNEQGASISRWSGPL
jgi:cholesterol oxidase